MIDPFAFKYNQKYPNGWYGKICTHKTGHNEICEKPIKYRLQLPTFITVPAAPYIYTCDEHLQDVLIRSKKAGFNLTVESV